MTIEEAFTIWLPMALFTSNNDPKCKEAIKMAARALYAIYDLRAEIEKNGNSDINTKTVLSIIDNQIAYVRGEE